MNKILFITILTMLSGLLNAQSSIEFKLIQPQKLVVDAGSDTSIKKGESLKVGSQDAIQGGTANYYHFWSPPYFLNDKFNLIATVRPEKDTSYVFYAKDARNCSATDTIKVRVTNSSATPDILGSDNLSLFPNPATEYFSIRANVALPAVTVRLSTLSGRVIFSETVEGSKLVSKKFDVPSETGVYLVMVGPSTGSGNTSTGSPSTSSGYAGSGYVGSGYAVVKTFKLIVTKN